jgi:hypothetical protein
MAKVEGSNPFIRFTQIPAMSDSDAELARRRGHRAGRRNTKLWRDRESC